MRKTTHVSIETTDACNLFCSACMTPHGDNFMEPEDFKELTTKLVGHITHLGLHWRGEPCLHPYLPEIAQTAVSLGFKPWISTNTAVPNLQDEEYVTRLFNALDWAEFCVDGYDEKTVSIYRVGAKWGTVRRNLETVARVKTKCVKKMRVLMFKYNDGKEDVYREMAKKYGMDQLIFARPLLGLEETISTATADRLLSSNKKYQRYAKRNGAWHRITGKCNPNPIISVHGTVHPCCLDWKLEHVLGNLFDETWRSIIGKYRKVVPQLGKQKMCELCCIPSQRVNFMEKII